jgi:hypothetical protein
MALLSIQLARLIVIVLNLLMHAWARLAFNFIVAIQPMLNVSKD